MMRESSSTGTDRAVWLALAVFIAGVSLCIVIGALLLRGIQQVNEQHSRWQLVHYTGLLWDELRQSTEPLGNLETLFLGSDSITYDEIQRVLGHLARRLPLMDTRGACVLLRQQGQPLKNMFPDKPACDNVNVTKNGSLLPLARTLAEKADQEDQVVLPVTEQGQLPSYLLAYRLSMPIGDVYLVMQSQLPRLIRQFADSYLEDGLLVRVDIRSRDSERVYTLHGTDVPLGGHVQFSHTEYRWGVNWTLTLFQGNQYLDGIRNKIVTAFVMAGIIIGLLANILIAVLVYYFRRGQQQLAELRQSQGQLKTASTVFMKHHDPVAILDADLRVTQVNEAFCAHFNTRLAQVRGLPESALHSRRHEPAFYQHIWNNVIRSGSWEGEAWYSLCNGEDHIGWVSISAVEGGADEPVNYIVAIRSLASLKEAEANIYRLAHFDQLTSLSNRFYFRQRIEDALLQAHAGDYPVAVLFIDLDDFKLINDALGHSVGDEFLRKLAQRIRYCLRDDDLLCRQGGDEFLAALPGVDRKLAGQVAQRIVEAIHDPIELEGHSLSVTASIGIAMYPDDSVDVDNLIRFADVAMYRAKEAGRNTLQHFTPTLNAELEERLRVQQGLRQALAKGELFLEYQPVIDVTTGYPCSLEALVRWRHPEEGVISPGRFIPIAERSSLIIEIGRWVLRHACEQQRAWGDAGLPLLPLAINMSAAQFRAAGELQHLQTTLTESSIPPGMITLELTETALLVDAEESIVRLQQFNALGVKLALDDFGTGYSSLNYLRQFPVHRLKIDKSFIDEIAEHPNSRLIINAVIRLAKGVGLSVVAEGVETEAQARILMGEGCTLMQGFYFSRPISAAQVATWLASPPNLSLERTGRLADVQ